MTSGKPFVAEDAPDFVDSVRSVVEIQHQVRCTPTQKSSRYGAPVEAAHNESLQVQLRGDSQCETHFQRVVKGFKGLGIRSAGLGVQNGSLNLTEPYSCISISSSDL